MRLDKWLAHTGFGTRKDVKQLLKSGAVQVNGTVIKDGKKQVFAEADQVTVWGEESVYKEFVYVMMHKPPGVISATEDARHKTVIDLLEEPYLYMDLFPVGRLDRDTEGFLLLTNDGQLSHALLSPKKHVPKTYYAEVEGEVTSKDQQLFQRGVTLDDGYETKPSKLEILSSGSVSTIRLTITEGKFHQVKRMFEAVGKKVTYLKREKMGGLTLDANLEIGSYRELKDEELSLLKGEKVSE